MSIVLSTGYVKGCQEWRMSIVPFDRIRQGVSGLEIQYSTFRQDMSMGIMGGG